MIKHWSAHRNRVVGSQARRHIFAEGRTFYYDDPLFDSSAYSIILPEHMIMSRKNFASYLSSAFVSVRQAAGSQSVRCDGVALNSVITSITGSPPLRVLLPRSSVTDHYEACLETQYGRADFKLNGDYAIGHTECMMSIASLFDSFPLVSIFS